jgi:hypothetical protein
MAWNDTRRLILPTALTVTTFAVAAAVVVACGGDDETKKVAQPVGPCADQEPNACVLCTDADGKAKCGPVKDCYPDVDNECHPGGYS